jgi:hypothetical protein
MPPSTETLKAPKNFLRKLQDTILTAVATNMMTFELKETTRARMKSAACCIWSIKKEEKRNVKKI